jgi:putative ABC transport system substrate-binding protein
MKHLAVALLSFALLAAPVAAEAQPEKVYRIGLLAWEDCPTTSPYHQALRELGYVEGRNLSVICRTAQRRDDGLVAAARELVQLGVDVIAALTHPAARAARQATNTVPIVMVASGDPVGAGLVASLARPGGNVTGLTYYATELTAKRLDLLRETVPGITRIGVLQNPVVSYLPFLDDTRKAAERLGLGLQVEAVNVPEDVSKAFRAFAQAGVQAVFVLPDLLLSSEAKQIAKLGLTHKLPTMAWGPWFAQAGCLITYSGDYRNMMRRAADLTVKILQGANPAQLPVEQPTTFLLAINLKTAKALGLTIPPSVLARADEVIQ